MQSAFLKRRSWNTSSAKVPRPAGLPGSPFRGHSCPDYMQVAVHGMAKPEPLNVGVGTMGQPGPLSGNFILPLHMAADAPAAGVTQHI